MKIEIKKIIRGVDLGEYAEEFKGETLQVWVNPTRGFMSERDDLSTEFNRRLEEVKLMNEKAEDFQEWTLKTFLPEISGWFARLWSQGDNHEMHWTTDELIVLDENDPALLDFMKRRSIKLIDEHRRREKKS